MKTCLDEGTLQAYLDGELSTDASNGVGAHLAACASCAGAARAAEEELALFSTAYAPALSASVPTEKLRARLDEAIAALNTPTRRFAPAATPAPSRLRSYFDSLVASLTTFTPRQATAFASFLVAVGLAVVFALMQTPDNANAPELIARNNQAPASRVAPNDNRATRGNEDAGRDDESAKRGDEGAGRMPGDVANAPAPARGDDRAALLKAGLKNVHPRISGARAERSGERENANAATVAANTNNTVAAAATTGEPVLADEKTYLSSIASLTSAIEAEGAQEAMTPTLRAEYERNLAVVNQAIVSSRVAARRNPQDTDAKEFLRAAYQNKVELLSAVADQTQLASGRD